MLHPNFKGLSYRLSNNWVSNIPIPNGPIRYAEIGTRYGASLVSVAQTYGKHPDSLLIAIDPWEDYADYPEKKGQQATIYEEFKRNMVACGIENRVTVKRGYSHEVVPTLEDNSFDIIYIDGNHEPEYVLEDGVLAFRKVKIGGHLIFDDYGWGGPDMVKRGIDAFVHAYFKRIKVLGTKDSQVFVQRTR